MSTPDPSYPSKLIFPSWCLDDITVEDEFQTTIQASRGGETRNSDVTLSRFTIDLSGGLCQEADRREVRAFVRAVRGRWKTFLFRRYRDAEWELDGPDGQGELLGLGDGARTVYQARIYDEFQEQPVQYIVRYLDHLIPEMGQNPHGQYRAQTRTAQVSVGGAILRLGDDYSIDRESGAVTLHSPAATGAEVRLKCGFFALVRLNQEGISMKPIGNGWYQIPDDVALIEPQGGR